MRSLYPQPSRPDQPVAEVASKGCETETRVRSSSARDAWNEIDVAVGLQHLIAGIGIDLAVDCDGHLAELLRDLWKALSKRRDELGHARGVDVHCFDAAGVLRETARQMNV